MLFLQALAVLTRWSGPQDNDPTNGGETEATSWVWDGSRETTCLNYLPISLSR